ncbi:MAG: hypothetical protein ABSE47_16685, partial [Acidimicrobiales bacterium]
VRLLGGRVWVEPNGSRGARFVVELPAEAPFDLEQPVVGTATLTPRKQGQRRLPSTLTTTPGEATSGDGRRDVGGQPVKGTDS